MGEATQLPARWFNGRSSRAREVRVALTPGPRGPRLQLIPLDPADGPAREFEHDAVGWPPAWSSRRHPTTLSVELRDAGSLQIDNPQAWHDALARCGARPGLAQRMQTHWPVFVAVLLVAVVGLGAFYRYGTPWAAMQLTRLVPLAWEESLSQRVMTRIDQGRMLKPSELPVARQAELRARFDALVRQLGPKLTPYPGHKPRYTLDFRHGMGANAFALPGGIVVMTDELVTTAAQNGLGDEALIGVLAHEIGHVAYRHGTRLVVEQGVLQIGLGLAMGDVSNIVSLGSTLLTSLAYRRQHEAEADCFAQALLRQAALPTSPMADLLIAISSARDDGAKTQAHKHEEKGEVGLFEGLFSSHPQTAQRARQLKAGEAGSCPL
ncbi:MAG: M48 family metallopeptidase [Hylemonella sp.]|nr:M48 family metallopeptidase [Hylemonella sp.]